MPRFVRSPLGVLFPWLLFPAAGSAQVQPGQPAPRLPAATPGIAVLAFHRTLAGAAGDGDVLRALQQRHGDKVAVRVVVPAAAPERPPALQDLAIEVDGDGSLRKAWLGQEPEDLVAVAAAGTVQWVGPPEAGLAAAVAAAVAGTGDVAAAARLYKLRLQLLETWGDSKPQATRDLLARILAAGPTDGSAW